MSRINAEMLATRFQSALQGKDQLLARDLESIPRFGDLLWFVQWWSLQDGGLDTLARDVLTHTGDRIGTRKMRELAPAPNNGPWSLDDCMMVWQEIPRNYRVRDGFMAWEDETYPYDFLEHGWKIGPQREATPKSMREGWVRYNRDWVLSLCVDAAEKDLAADIAAIVTGECGLGKCPWYFHELLDCLFEAMHRHSRSALSKIGQNRTVEMVFNALNMALATKNPMLILGDSRAGKTCGLSVWTSMQPGIARLITLPDSNREWELYAAHADGLGVEYANTTPIRLLSRSVAFTARYSRLFFAYDEAHFLFPTRIAKNTKPQRLNWVRTHIIDQGLGCAFFSTRQTYERTQAEFARVTRYQLDQWTGRVTAQLILPQTLSYDEMLVAGRTLFPLWHSDCVEYLVARCEAVEQGFRILKPLGDYASAFARLAGRAEVTINDIQSTAAQYYPHLLGGLDLTVADQAESAIRKAPAKRSRKARAAGADPIEDPGENRISGVVVDRKASLPGPDLVSA